MSFYFIKCHIIKFGMCKIKYGVHEIKSYCLIMLFYEQEILFYDLALWS